jgi:hypothetical protein
MRMTVDLPPPFGPIMPMRARSATSKSSPLRIVRAPKDFETPLRLIWMIVHLPWFRPAAADRACRDGYCTAQ